MKKLMLLPFLFASAASMAAPATPAVLDCYNGYFETELRLAPVAGTGQEGPSGKSFSFAYTLTLGEARINENAGLPAGQSYRIRGTIGCWMDASDAFLVDCSQWSTNATAEGVVDGKSYALHIAALTFTTSEVTTRVIGSTGQPMRTLDLTLAGLVPGASNDLFVQEQVQFGAVGTFGESVIGCQAQ